MAEPLYRNRDYTVSAFGVQNSVSGAYFTASATGSWTLYDADGEEVDTGSLTFTVGSSGDFTGTIEETTTATLTVGARYRVAMELEEGSANWADTLNLTAQDPGEILIDAEIWQSYSGNSVTGNDLISASNWAASVRKALLRVLRPYIPEPQDGVTFYVDGPPKPTLILPVRPVRSITSLRLHPRAFGLEANFTSADELVEGVDWYQEKDPLDGTNRTGLIRLAQRSVWSYSTRREVGRLAGTIGPDRGAIRVVANVGEATVPEDIRSAAVACVSLLMQRRATGTPLQSESWAGYSASYAGPFTAEAAIRSPEVQALLAPYLTMHIG